MSDDLKLKQMVDEAVRNAMGDLMAQMTKSIADAFTPVLKSLADIVGELKELKKATTVPPPLPPTVEHRRSSAREEAEEEVRSRSLVFLRVDEQPVSTLPRDRNGKDTEAVYSILDEIGSDARLEKVFRMGVYNANRWRPIKVVCNNTHDCSQVLNLCRSLKSSKSFSKVYIRRSLSSSELAERRQRRSMPGRSMPDRLQVDNPSIKLIIRNGKVVPSTDSSGPKSQQLGFTQPEGRGEVM